MPALFAKLHEQLKACQSQLSCDPWDTKPPALPLKALIIATVLLEASSAAVRTGLK
jgi:hypothetical protein